MQCWWKNKLIGSEPNRVDDDLIDTGQDDTNLSDDEKYTSQIHQQISEKYIYKSIADIMPTSSTNQNRGYNIEGETEPVFHNMHSRKHYLARPQHTADSSYEKSIREQAKFLYQLMYNDDCGMFISPFEIHSQDSLRQEHHNKPVERNSVVFGTVHQDKTAHNQFEISHVKDMSIPLQSESFSDVGFNYDMFNLKTNTKIVTTKKPEASKCCNNLEDSQSNLAGNAQYNTKKTYSNIEQRRNDILPECLKNCYGSLVKKIESNTKESNLFLMTSVLGKILKVYVSNKMVYVENGVTHNCIDIKQELKVQFDCRINDEKYYASVIWIGEKPHSVVKGRQKDVVYFDIPAKYYGTIENKHQIIANINGSIIHIKVDSVIIYSSEGKQFTEQLESDSLLCLDLVQTYQQEWKILFALLNSMNVINRFLDNWPTKFISSWYFPGYLQSWPATLVPICIDNVIEHCLVKYKIGVCSQETIYPKLKYYVNNGKLHTCEKITSYLKVQFDAHLNADNTRYVIDLIWIGAKPSKIQINNYTKYFNIPAIYYGRHADPQIIARVGETFVPVTVNPNTLSTCFYKSKDKLAVSSVNPSSLLTISLSEITLEDGFVVFKLEFAIIHSTGSKCTAKTIDWPKSYSKYTDVSNKNSKDTCSDVDRTNEISNPLFEKQHEITNPLFEKQHIIEEDHFENISCASCTITYERVNNATIHQSYRSSENTNQPNNLMNTTFSVLKSVLKNNAKHLSNLLHMTGSFAGKYEYHGFIESQDKVIIFHMNYLYQNGISSNKDINIGKGMSCFGYLLNNTINICNFSVTHIATVAFTGKKPENSEEINSFWKNEFVTEKKQPETEQPISSCSKDLFAPQRDSEDFLCTFKRVCMYSNTFYSNRHIHGGISGIFENQNGSIGFIKAASMTIVFHTEYLFHGTPKLKNLFDSGKCMNLSCFCCQLDNSVNFGEHCVTHVGIVVFTGKKPEDTEEIITSWKSRFVTGKKPVITEGKITSWTKDFDVPQKDSEDFLNIFKRVCINSNVHISCGISGIFENQEGCIGFIKSKSMKAVFHTEYLFHGHPKLKNLFDSGRRMDLSCLSFQLDNAVYFGELCVTYVGVVVFTGKKPKDSEEIFISWKNRFVKSKDKGKELQFKENPIENTCSVINQNTDNSEQNVSFINNFPSQRKTAKKGSINLKSVLRELDIIKSNSTSKQLKKGNHKQNQADRNETSASLSSPDITPKSTKKKKLGKCQSKDQQPIKNAVTSGIISNIEPNVVEFYTKTGDYFEITRDRCFLYNVCLQAVDLTHILLKDSEVEYELCDEGKEVKGIWLPSSSISLDSQDIYFNICLWCDKYNVPDYTRDCLLNTLNWEPTIYVPTVDSDDDTEIVTA